MAKAPAKQTKSKITAKGKAPIKATASKAPAKPATAKAAVAKPTVAPAPSKKIEHTNATGMWKLLEMKEQRQKLANQQQHKRAMGQNGRNQMTNQNDHFAKFSGPRRRAA